MCLEPHIYPTKQFLYLLADCCTHILNCLAPALLKSPSIQTFCDQIVSLSRKVLEQKKKAEEEEERWMERQRQKEKKLQKVVLKRAQANDPHQALSQTHQIKLKEFRYPKKQHDYSMT